MSANSAPTGAIGKSASFLLICWVWILNGLPAAAGQFRDLGAQSSHPGEGKAAFADYNADGLIDLYAGGVLLRNIGNGQFSPVGGSGLPGGSGIWADYDNDGDPDLFVYTRGELYRNEGNGKFVRAGFPELRANTSRAAVWVDINNDALPDLYVAGYEVYQKEIYPDIIFRNTGNGRFVEHWRSSADETRSARGVTAADYNDDGNMDIYVSNYRLQQNALLKGDGNGNFIDIGVETRASGQLRNRITYVGKQYQVSGHTIGSAFGDLNNDGLIDLFVANFSHSAVGQDRPQFLQNYGKKLRYTFVDKSADVNLHWQESYASAALADFDNDGDMDFFFSTVYEKSTEGEPNHSVLYRNDGDWTFSDVGEREKLPLLGPTYQAAWGDIDNDGDLDLVSNGRVLLNEKRSGNWIGLILFGDGRAVSRSALGATARIRLGKGKTLTRHVDAATGEGNQSDRRLHFGLGEYKQPIDVEVRWPGGDRTVYQGLEPARYHNLVYK